MEEFKQKIESMKDEQLVCDEMALLEKAEDLIEFVIPLAPSIHISSRAAVLEFDVPNVP